MLKLAGGAAGAAAAVLVAFLVLGSGSTPLSDPIARAASVSDGTPGFRMRMFLQVSSPELGTLVTGTARATVDLRDHASAMTLLMNVEQAQALAGLGNGQMQLGMVLQGTTLYLRLPDQIAGVLGAGKPWVELDLSKLGGVSGLSSLQGNTLGADPTRILDYLRGVSDTVASRGRTRVDGFATTHYTATLDLDRVAGLLPAADQKGLSALETLTQVHTIPVDVWIDTHQLVRRMSLALSLALPGRAAMSESMTVDFSDYGPQPRPAAPPASQVQALPGLPG